MAETIKSLREGLRKHAIAMAVSKDEPAVYQFHMSSFRKLKAELEKRESAQAKVSPQLAAARNARWRHFGAIGGLRMALANVKAVRGMSTVTEETRQLAMLAENSLTLLLDSLRIRKD